MATVLIAWELGGNRGHVMSLMPIARNLQRRGHRVCMAVRSLEFVPDEFAKEIVFLQAPLWLRPPEAPELFGYVDILTASGYASSGSLHRLVSAWQRLIELTGADLILAEHAPTALLAARVAGCKAATIGTGFTCPPPHAPMPGFSTLSEQHRSLLTGREQQLLAHCSTVLELSGGPLLETFAQLFTSIPSLLCTYPELDHYGARFGVDYLGPLYSEVESNPVSWPGVFDFKVLIYLNDFRNWGVLEPALRTIAADILMIAPGLPTNIPEFELGSHIKIMRHAIGLQATIERCDLVICHGGIGTTAGALDKAKPVLLLPMQKEQLMLALRVASQKLGGYLLPGFTAGDLCAAVAALRASSAIEEAVSRFATRNSEPMISRVDKVGRIVEQLL